MPRWDTRLLGDNESAPLTDLEKRKPQEAAPNKQSQSENAEQSAEQQKNLQEIIEETKSQLIEQLKDVQEQINE
ncbi:7597_t:CDS:2, partial [Racocetra persica]